jgi:glycosyltransferase involved in cell wall biosynthesis
VVFTGTVDDVRPYLSKSSVCIVPVRVAGGSRIKILEAMAAGLPVVSTAEGAEGLEVVPGEHVLIARDETDFARCVIQLLDDRSLVQSLTAKAGKLVEERYDWEQIAPLLEQAWKETIVRFKQRKKASLD